MPVCLYLRVFVVCEEVLFDYGEDTSMATELLGMLDACMSGNTEEQDEQDNTNTGTMLR